MKLVWLSTLFGTMLTVACFYLFRYAFGIGAGWSVFDAYCLTAAVFYCGVHYELRTAGSNWFIYHMTRFGLTCILALAPGIFFYALDELEPPKDPDRSVPAIIFVAACLPSIAFFVAFFWTGSHWYQAYAATAMVLCVQYIIAIFYPDRISEAGTIGTSSGK